MTAESACAAGAADGHGPSFTVDLDLIGGRLKLAGPLVRDTTHLFHDAIVTLLVCHRPRWTVDLSELTACGRSGPHAIAGARRWAQRQNRHIVLVGTPLWLQEELTRLQPHQRPTSDIPGVVHAVDAARAGAAPDRHPPPPASKPGPPADRELRGEVSPQAPLCTATVDGTSGTIAIRGHLDGVGADLLSGSVVALQRLGRRHIGVQLRPGATVDADARRALTALAQRMSAEGVRLGIS